MTDKRTYLKAYRQDYKSNHKRVYLTMSRVDYERFAEVAAREGRAVASLILGYAFAGLDGSAIPEAIAEDLAEVKFLIANIANNINQMARHANTVRAFTDDAGLIRELERLQTVIADHTTKSIRDAHDY